MSKQRNKFRQGIFEPVNKKKYLCKKKYAYYRSGWELTFMQKMDANDKIIGWCSECKTIPYTFNGKQHRYYPDFLVIKEDGTTILVEVKPLKQTKPPKKSKGKSKKSLLYESIMYHKNLAKWEAANNYCKKRNWKFMVMTEKTLTI